MLRLLKCAFFGFLFLALLFVVYVAIHYRKPVLFHAFSSCACTDYSYEVTGLTIFNPFRNRDPEKAADKFFEKFGVGLCPADSVTSHFFEDCKKYSTRIPNLKWRLKNRTDTITGASLFYQFDRAEYAGHSYFRFGGEGALNLILDQGNWKVASFDVIW